MAGVKLTEFAQQAVGLADIFHEAFKRPLPGRPANYRVQLAVPDGPSTGGGRQGTQHVKLVPIGEGPTLVAGWANPADREAEIRSWEHLKAILGERAGATGAPDEAAYRKLVLDMKRFFEGEKLSVSVVAAPRQVDDALASSAAGNSSLSPVILVLGIVGGLAIVAIAAALILMR
jgi:hypothetical protein